MLISFSIQADTPQELASAIVGLASNYSTVAEKPDPIANKPKSEKTKTETAGGNTIVSQPVKDTPEQSNEGSSEKITVEKVREVVQAKSIAGKKDEIKALLKNDYGAANVTSLAPEHYSSFLKKVNAL